MKRLHAVTVKGDKGNAASGEWIEGEGI